MAMLRLCTCCLLLAAASAAADEARGLRPLAVVAGDGREVVRFTSHHALVIGNSRYTNGWQPLPGVAVDVAAMRAALERQGFAVEVASRLGEKPGYRSRDLGFRFVVAP